MRPRLPDPATRSQAPPSAIAASTSTAPLFPDLIPNIITYNSLNILAGASGVGKTCLLAWMITRFRRGAPVFGAAVTAPAAIGYVCADRGFTSARYWLGKVGMNDLPFYSLADDLAFSTVRLRNKFHLVSILGECLDKLRLPPGSLVVVDPLALFMGGSLNDYQSCAIACIEIRRACMQRQLTLIGTAHASKQKNDRKDQYNRLQDRILGSSAQLGYGDTQMYLASPEETGEKFYSFIWHPHTAPAELFPLGRDGEGMFVPWEVSPLAIEENAILLAVPYTEEGVGFGELIVTAAASKSTVHRYLQELLKAGMIERVGHGRYRRVALH